MMNNKYNSFRTTQELADNLALKVTEILTEAIQKNGKATLLLSGGNTPKLFLNTLSKKELPWENIIVGLVDERCVATTNKDSNEYLIKNELCINKAKNLDFVGLSHSDYEDIYKKTFQNIDVLILGMGADGHTASLFPYNEKLPLAYALDNRSFCIKITPDTAPYERISLTLNSILKAKNIFLHIEGDAKIKVYNEVIQSNDTKKYPVLKVLNSSKSIKVYAR